jgi:Holliday junction resolvase-like predicted endonuclease
VRFVEVKAVSRESLENISREKEGYRPEEQVHPGKLKKLCRTAEMYMSEREDARDYQIDVVTVLMDHHTRTARCRLYEQVL